MADQPEWGRAVLDIRKLREYCLSRDHLRGRHKARVFDRALGIGREDAAWLREAILKGVPGSGKAEMDSDRFGTRWRADIAIARHDSALW
jgi:hypothetical protein